jgi:predicted DNA-binding transcriptional regulator AlpA
MSAPNFATAATLSEPGVDSSPDSPRPARFAEAANESSLPAVLTVPELAALLRLKPKSVYALLSRDRDAIPGVRKVGGAWRAHRATVLAWLAGQNSDARQRQRGVR